MIMMIMVMVYYVKNIIYNADCIGCDVFFPFILYESFTYFSFNPVNLFLISVTLQSSKIFHH